MAAYALGVLDDDDAEAFERHLDECAPCRAELLEAQELPGMLDAVKDGSVSSSERSHP
ncbi:hypothetical protein Misp03_13890 [Microbispora sp. NBRC 16548]|nr:hypothetical protein Misp03_13890 [Microbispora sp. NBRC 16548]